MKRKLKIELIIEVEDLDEETRLEGTFTAEDGDEEDEAPATVAELDPMEVARVLEDINSSANDELFGGTDIYARFGTAVVVDAQWIGDAA